MLFVAKWEQDKLVVSLLRHLLPTSVFGVQMVILILLMINLLRTSDHQFITAMNVPANVPLAVRVSQYIAATVAVFTADDLVTGVLHIGKRVVERDHVRRTHVRCRMGLLRSVSLAHQLTKTKNRNWKWQFTK